MNPNETRIFSLPSLLSDYAIVSMPQTAWYWLDDLVKKQYPGGYKALMRAFEKAETPQSLSASLHSRAREHCEAQMATLYCLSNDNKPLKAYADPAAPLTLPGDKTAPQSRMPTVYRLFHFLAHPTTLTTIWERRNYHLKGEHKH